MREWTKAIGVLLAAVSCVSIIPGIYAADPAAPKTAVKSDEADPFAKSPSAAVMPGRDLSKDELQITDLGMVEIHAADVPLVDILRSLSIQMRKNIVASKGVTGTVTANLFNVTFREALDAILHANGYAYRESGNFIYVYTAKELEDIQKAERKAVTEVFRLNYVPAEVAVVMIKPAMSTESQVAVSKAPTMGLPTEATTAGGNSLAIEDTLVITDYPENIEAIKKILVELDRRPQQILIESTIMVARLTDNNSLGVDFTLLGGVDFSTLGNVAAGGSTGNTGGATGAAGSSVLDNPNANAVVNNGYSTVGTRVLPTQQSGSGLNIGVVTNNVAMFVNALESITDSTVLANPKILTLNKQAGAVIVGRKDGYITTTTSSTTTSQTVEFLETGTRLVFRPYIADDGFIRMELHPEDSTGSVQVTGAFALPSKTTTEVTTNVLVRDGHTIVIGGLFREDNTVSKSQVPVLGDIPWAGALFRNQSDRSVRQEVIILITPHIIKDDSAYSAASLEVAKQVEMMRAGLRKGMMPWSRDRLAEMSYKTAREETAKKYYDRDRAMWYLDCATNLNPAFAEALVMKQKISGEQLMESDNSSMRHFLGDMVMDEQVGTTPAIQPPVMVPAPVSPATPVIVPVPEEKKATPPEVVPAPVPTPAPAPVEKAMEPKSDATPVEPAVKELPATTVAPDTGANK